jgi:hypothetical protein
LHSKKLETYRDRPLEIDEIIKHFFKYLGLSKPFRQLEKYASVSLELEQHMEDDHTDRGDCQRSIGYYKNVAAECANHRRQKELELEIMTGNFNFYEQQRRKMKK